MDSRATAQAKEIAEKTGTYRPPTYNGPKLLWIRDHEPDIYRRIHWVQSCSGFICSKLVGRQVIDITDNEFYDFTRKKWDEQLLDKIGVPAEWIPSPVITGESMGDVTPEVSQELGLHKPTPIIAAPFDGMASLHGVGVMRPGQCALVLGTSTGVGVMTTVVPPSSTRLFVARHFHNWDWWLVGGVMSMGGAAYDWFRKKILQDKKSRNVDASAHQALDSLVEDTPSGAGGLIFLPYLTGERSPIWDNKARGTFFGLSTMHNRAHLLRSLIEGIGFGIRHNIDVMAEHHVIAEEYRVTGGIGKSLVWTQIFSDILGEKILIPRYLDAETLGDAMLVAVNIGLYRNHEEAAAAMVQISRTVYPNPANKRLYSDLYAIYRDLYPRLKTLYAQRYEVVEKHHLEEKDEGAIGH